MLFVLIQCSSGLYSTEAFTSWVLLIMILKCKQLRFNYPHAGYVDDQVAASASAAELECSPGRLPLN